MSVFYLKGKRCEGMLIGVVTPYQRTFKEWEKSAKPDEYFKMISTVWDMRGLEFDRIEFAHDEHHLSSGVRTSIRDEMPFRIKK